MIRRLRGMLSIRDLSATGVHNVLFLLCWCVYTAAYVGRLNYSACLAKIIQDCGFSRVEGGWIGTAFFVVYGLGQLMNGFIGDKISPKWMLFVGMLGSGLVNFVFAQMTTPAGMIVVWCFNGFFQSLLWSPIIRIFSEWFHPEYRLHACVKINTTVSVGTVLAYLLSVAFIAGGTWRGMFQLSGVLLVFMSVVWIVLVPKLENTGVFLRREEIPEPVKEEEKDAVPSIGFWKLMLISGMPLLLPALIAQGVLKDGVTSWVPTYTEELFHLNSAASVFGTMFIPLVNLAGVYLADWMNRYWVKNELITSGLMYALNTGVVALLLLGTNLGAGMSFAVLAISTTMMTGANTMLVAILPLEFARHQKSSSVSGVLNFAIYVGSGLSVAGTGWLSSALGWPPTILVWALCSVLGAISCFVAIRVWFRFKKANATHGGKADSPA